MKMKTVYEANPALGDPMSIQVIYFSLLPYFFALASYFILNRVNWQRMGIDWTNWGQIFGDIRWNKKEKHCPSTLESIQFIANPRDGWRRRKGELLEVRQVHWAVEAMVMVAVLGGLPCQMKWRVWAGERSKQKLLWYLLLICLK